MSDGMGDQVPNGFHQALVSATVFLAGLTCAYIKFIAVDGSMGEWSLFAAVSTLGAFGAVMMQVETLRRALRTDNDDPRQFARTAGLLIRSVWLLIGSAVALAIAHWWQPWPALTQWMNSGGP